LQKAQASALDEGNDAHLATTYHSSTPPILYVDPAADIQFLVEQLSSVRFKKKLVMAGAEQKQKQFI
jgi:hypothetical protein